MMERNATYAVGLRTGGDKGDISYASPHICAPPEGRGPTHPLSNDLLCKVHLDLP